MIGNTYQANQTLVLGGTGKTGRRVVQRLTAHGVPARVGSRSGQPPFDWEDPSTWAAALDGVGSVYISYYPDIAAPGAVQVVGSFAELAVHSGARRLVLLAGRGEPESESAEQADDIADVAVAALTEDGHVGRLYELTGPRLLTFAEAVHEIAEATGREIRYVPVSIDEYATAATGQGVPDEVIDILTYLFGEVLDGRNAHLADGVQRALGREPRDFADYARTAAATGVWSPSAVTA